MELILTEKEVLEALFYAFDRMTAKQYFDDSELRTDEINISWLKAGDQCHLMYLRGELDDAKRCFIDTIDPRQKMTCAITVMMAAAVQGDLETFKKVDVFCDEYNKRYDQSEVQLYMELAFSVVATSLRLPEVAPQWLKDSELEVFPHGKRLLATYIRAKYLMSLKKYSTVCSICRTGFTLYCDEDSASAVEIYMLLLCGTSFEIMGHGERAVKYYDKALEMGKSLGFITPFAESLLSFGNLLEERAQIIYPQLFEKIDMAGIEPWKNLLKLRNVYSYNKISMELTNKEFEIARRLVAGYTYKEISSEFNLSLGRINNIVIEIYEKLGVHSKKELKKVMF